MPLYYCGGHSAIKCVGLPTTLDFFVCFWPILLYVFRIIGDHVTFLYESLFILFFSKYKVIAVLATEFEHTMMSNLLYAYPYMYSS